ncbi:MAG: hypothetical protein M1820_006828 [Bogoriella megaspora]|nr:MAG: hypothetical protein M1820_006828 [Bogoriella megaspora]
MAFNRLSVLSLLASRSVIAYPSQNAQNQTIAWAPCPGLTEDILCGSLKVPLDYTNPTSSETLELKMVKVAAVKAPKKGSILFNPGGPGSGGRDMVADGKDGYHVISGGQYDLIGFDPRGTSDTLPINCFASEQEENLFKNDFQSLPNETDTALGVYVAGTIVRADACYENNKNTGDLLGTAFVARDMLQVVNALQEDGLLNFWGKSDPSILLLAG